MNMKKIDALLVLSLFLGTLPSNIISAKEQVQISKPEEFAAYIADLRNGLQKDAILTSDINLSEVCSEQNPLKTIYNFNSTFDGNGYEISGLYINSGGNINALFQETGESAIIKNLTVSGNVYGTRASGLIDTNYGLVDNVISKMNVYGSTNSAGIVYNNNGLITNSENQGEININAEGSIAGIAIMSKNGGSIVNCKNYGSINGANGSIAAEKTSGICCVVDGGEFRNNINLGPVTGTLNTSGVATSVSNIKSVANCINIGNVKGNGEGVAGVVDFASNSDLINCSNYGDISNSNNNTAGITITSNSTLTDCSNYGNVSGESYVAGIISNAGGNMWGDAEDDAELSNCTNSGKINGDTNVAGIAAFMNGNISNCYNYAPITGQKSRTAGIVSHFNSGNMDKCANIANITGTAANDLSTNFTGGVIAYMDDDNAINATVNNILSAGDISGINVCGGAIGYAKGTINNVVSYGKSNVAIHTDSNATKTNIYQSEYWGWPSDESPKFPTGELAYILNTNNGSEQNSQIWSQASSYPVLADNDFAYTKKIIIRDNSGTEHTVYTGKDGKASIPDGFDFDSVKCYDENNNEVDKNEVLRTNNNPSATAIVSNADELLSALSNPNITIINIKNSITLNNDVTIDGNKELIANKNRITFENGGFKVTGDVIVDNLSVVSKTPFTLSDSAKLTVCGYLEASNALLINNGSIDLSNGHIYNKNEINSIPQFTISNSEKVIGGDDLTDIGGSYYHFISLSSTEAWDIVAYKKDNPSLSIDVYPTYKGNTAYLFMPCTADMTNVTYSIITKDGTVLNEVSNVDLTKTSPSVTLKGVSYNVTAMQSTLPTLSFTIDESFGTIEAMNTSPDHSIKCFGDVRLDITNEVAAAKGWSGFVSKEKDSTKNGTMEIKGRGNSTWNTDPYAKKPYQFKLENKENILNMGSHKTWVIIKNDEHIIKNKLGLDLGLAMGLSTTSSSEFVDVFMNGNYLGNYLLCEKVQIDKSRVNITNLDDEYKDNGNSIEGLDMTGGYLMEIDNWGGDPLQVYHQPSSTTVSIKEPESLADRVTADNEYSYIYNYINDFLDSIYLNNGIMSDGKSYLDHIDKQSFVRYFFHQEFLRNADCGRGSTYLYKDKDSIDSKLYAGPIWDNDRIFEDGTTYTGWFLQTVKSAENDAPTLYNTLNRRMDFTNLLISGYETDPVIRESLKKAYEYVDIYVNDLDNSPKMNSIRWNLPEFNVEWLKQILQDRFGWIDANYKTLKDVATPDFVNVSHNKDIYS